MSLKDIQYGVELAFKHMFLTFGSRMGHEIKNEACDLRNEILQGTEEVLASSACGSSLSNSHHQQWGTVTISQVRAKRTLELVSCTGKQPQGWDRWK